MPTDRQLVFPPFRLDLANERLWQGEEGIEIRPKAFAISRYLVEHAGRLFTKEELLNAVWPGTAVVKEVLKIRIRELRGALGDDPAAPRLITESLSPSQTSSHQHLNVKRNEKTCRGYDI